MDETNVISGTEPNQNLWNFPRISWKLSNNVFSQWEECYTVLVPDDEEDVACTIFLEVQNVGNFSGHLRNYLKMQQEGNIDVSNIGN